MKKLLVLLSSIILMVQTNIFANDIDEKPYYLFTYFTDNSTYGQQIHYAISENGLDFTPLNNGMPVIASDTISISGGIRDPHILRGMDDSFLMVLTDMDWQKGKWSNRGIIMMKSDDLIHWTHSTVNFPGRFAGKTPAQANAVWAPQTIFDPTAGKYMVYFSLHSEKGGPYPTDSVYYAYSNPDFTDLESDPVRLFKYDGPAIDTDIVMDSNRKYHLFFNTWGDGGTKRRQYIFTDFHDPSTWTLLDGHNQPNNKRSEGSTAYQLVNGDWILCYDCFADNEFQFCKSKDLIHFELVKTTKTTDGFNPRHGSVIRITAKEYDRLVRNFK